jgi:hypothetical protein
LGRAAAAFFPRGGGADVGAGLAGVAPDKTVHGGIVAFPIIQVPQQEVMLAAGLGAKSDEVARIQFQIRPSAGDDAVEGEFVVNVHFGGFIAGGAFGMGGAEGALDLVPVRAARDAVFPKDGPVSGELLAHRHDAARVRRKSGGVNQQQLLAVS